MSSTLSIGDTVSLHRNMDHPAWRVLSKNEYGDISSTPRPGISEDLGTAQVKDLGRHAQLGEPGDFHYRPEQNLVFLSNGLWYDAATGMQDGSESTYFTV